MKGILEILLKAAVLLIAMYFVADMFKQPEPEPEISTTIEYKEGKPDTVTVRDTVYVAATFPVAAGEDGKLSLDTLHIHDEHTSVRVWSRDIAVEGVKIDVRTIVREVHIHTVDTLTIIETHIIEKKIPWHRTREIGVVLGVAGTLATVWAIGRLQ